MSTSAFSSSTKAQRAAARGLARRARRGDRAPAEMSFSAQIPSAGIEWSSAGIGGVFAQRSATCCGSAFWNMLGEIVALQPPRDAAPERIVAARTSPRSTTGSATSSTRIASRRAFATGTCCRCSARIWSCPTRADAAHAGRDAMAALLPRPRASAEHCAGRSGVRCAAARRRLRRQDARRDPRRPPRDAGPAASSGCRSAAPTSRPTRGTRALRRRRLSPVTASSRSRSSPTRATRNARSWAPSTGSATGRSCTPTSRVLPGARRLGRRGTTRGRARPFRRG